MVECCSKKDQNTASYNFFAWYNIFYISFQVTDLEDELKFSQALTKLLDEHKDVISILASGFKQTKKHIQVSIVMVVV